MKFLSTVILLLVCLVSSGQSIDDQIRTCQKDALTTAEMRECASQGRELWDKEMQKYYQLIEEKLPEGFRETLKLSQEGWETHKEREMRLMGMVYYQLKSGTMWWVEADYKHLELYRERALYLQDYYEVLLDE